MPNNLQKEIAEKNISSFDDSLLQEVAEQTKSYDWVIELLTHAWREMLWEDTLKILVSLSELEPSGLEAC